MREIIYIQAGTLANYAGTHFWNTQQSYFTYTDGEEPVTCHDISFREGLSPTGYPTFCPRLLVFDRQVNFGPLAKSNPLVGASDEDILSADSTALWGGDVVEYRRDPMPKSTYHTRIDESGDHAHAEGPGNAEVGPVAEDIRYWSDFNRVHYVPRTVQEIPDSAEWESSEGDWNSGQELFSRYNEDATLMEGSLRLFLEESDSVQGIQVMNDTSSFGSFINAFLTSFRDEFTKLPCLGFPLLSDTVFRKIDIDDYQGTRKAVNDAIYLCGLNELASMSIPIQSPLDWPSEARGRSFEPNRNRMYHDSAVLSAHVESSTLPLRLNGTHEDLASLCSQLDWRGTTPFGQLSGSISSTMDLENELVNFSAIHQKQESRQFTRRDVTRGFLLPEIVAYGSWSARLSLQDPFISRWRDCSRVHAPAYPLPTVYPSSYSFPDSNASRRPGIVTRSSSIPVFSSISTTRGTAHLFSTCAVTVETCLKRKIALDLIGFDADELKELVNDLWTLHDNFNDRGYDPGSGDNDPNTFGDEE